MKTGCWPLRAIQRCTSSHDRYEETAPHDTPTWSRVSSGQPRRICPVDVLWPRQSFTFASAHTVVCCFAQRTPGSYQEREYGVQHGEYMAWRLGDHHGPNAAEGTTRGTASERFTTLSCEPNLALSVPVWGLQAASCCHGLRTPHCRLYFRAPTCPLSPLLPLVSKSHSSFLDLVISDTASWQICHLRSAMRRCGATNGTP